MTWFDDLMKDAEECRQKAREAKTPTMAKKWYEAAEAATRAAMASIPMPSYQQMPITVEPIPQPWVQPAPAWQPPYTCGTVTVDGNGTTLVN